MLVGEARLWYESLRPINVDWNGLQNQFRQLAGQLSSTTFMNIKGILVQRIHLINRIV